MPANSKFVLRSKRLEPIDGVRHRHHHRRDRRH
jgi:hypothetical protein